MKKNNPLRKSAIARRALTVGLLVAGSGFLLISSGKKKLPVPAYHVERVIDGDTFITKEDQTIRLANIEAPELHRCGGQEAKRTLERLVLGKPIYLKVMYRDQYQRLISFVYTPDGYVNQKIVEAGMAVGLQKVERDPEIEQATKIARENGVGIFSAECTQRVNAINSDCVIKANAANEKLYRFPGCGQYTNTIVQLYAGDEWFCTEKEAKAAGFTKGSDCFEKSWKP